MKIPSKHVWPWQRPKSPTEVVILLHEFYMGCHKRINQQTSKAAQSLTRKEAGAFHFSEDWKNGDTRFGRPSHRIRLGWITATRTDPDRFRLCVVYDRFHLTLPFVTDGIK